MGDAIHLTIVLPASVAYTYSQIVEQIAKAQSLEMGQGNNIIYI